MSKLLYTINDELASIGFKIYEDDECHVAMERSIPAVSVREYENYLGETVTQRVIISLRNVSKMCMRVIMYDEMYCKECPDIVGLSAADLAVISRLMTPSYCFYRRSSAANE